MSRQHDETRLRAFEDARSAVHDKVRQALKALFPIGTIVKARPYGEANRKGIGEVVAWNGSNSEVTVRFFEMFKKQRGSRRYRKLDIHWERIEVWPTSTEEL